MREFTESWAPLLSDLVMSWPTEDFMYISGVVSLIVCSLAVGGATFFFFFFTKKGVEPQKG